MNSSRGVRPARDFLTLMLAIGTLGIHCSRRTPAGSNEEAS